MSHGVYKLLPSKPSPASGVSVSDSNLRSRCPCRPRPFPSRSYNSVHLQLMGAVAVYASKLSIQEV